MKTEQIKIITAGLLVTPLTPLSIKGSKSVTGLQRLSYQGLCPSFSYKSCRVVLFTALPFPLDCEHLTLKQFHNQIQINKTLKKVKSNQISRKSKKKLTEKERKKRDWIARTIEKRIIQI